MTLKAADYVAVIVDGLKRSIACYTKVLGLPVHQITLNKIG